MVFRGIGLGRVEMKRARKYEGASNWGMVSGSGGGGGEGGVMWTRVSGCRLSSKEESAGMVFTFLLSK